MGRKKRICIDLTNAVPGTGGSGGGIVTYAVNLITHLDQALKNQGIEVWCLKNSRFANFPALRNIRTFDVNVNNQSLFSRLYWLHVQLPLFCRKNRIHTVHRIVAELPLVRPARFIVTLHDFMFDLYLENERLRGYLSRKDRIKFRFLNVVNKASLRRSDSIVVLSNTVKQEVLDRFPGAERKINVTRMASGLEHLGDIRKKMESGKDLVRIGTVAGFFPHKGHLRVLKLAHQFRELGFQNFKIYFRGSQVDKAYVAEVQQQIKQSGLEDLVCFEPYEPNVTLEKIYAKYDVVLMLSDYEGFGLPVLEAQAFSSVVVCSDIPVFKEILGDSAIFLKADFSREAVHELTAKLQDKEFLATLRQRGSANVKRFSWLRMAEETKNVYEKSLLI